MQDDEARDRPACRHKTCSKHATLSLWDRVGGHGCADCWLDGYLAEVCKEERRAGLRAGWNAGYVQGAEDAEAKRPPDTEKRKKQLAYLLGALTRFRGAIPKR